MTLISSAYGFQERDQGKKKVEKVEEKADEVVTSALFLKNATLHTMASGGTMVGSIHVENGRIKAIGPKVKVPKEAKVYDLKGFHATPGLIESRGKLWISPQAAAESNSKAELQVVDAVDPWNEDWKELAAQGITSVYVQPGSTSSVGGVGAVLRVGPHGLVENIVMKKDVAIQVSIGTRGRSSKERAAQVKALETLLKSAKDKKKDKDKDSKDSDKDDKKKDADETKTKTNQTRKKRRTTKTKSQRRKTSPRSCSSEF